MPSSPRSRIAGKRKERTVDGRVRSRRLFDLLTEAVHILRRIDLLDDRLGMPRDL